MELTDVIIQTLCIILQERKNSHNVDNYSNTALNLAVLSSI